jgi:hypothetical protein
VNAKKRPIEINMQTGTVDNRVTSLAERVNRANWAHDARFRLLPHRRKVFFEHFRKIRSPLLTFFERRTAIKDIYDIIDLRTRRSMRVIDQKRQAPYCDSFFVHIALPAFRRGKGRKRRVIWLGAGFESQRSERNRGLTRSKSFSFSRRTAGRAS